MSKRLWSTLWFDKSILGVLNPMLPEMMLLRIVMFSKLVSLSVIWKQMLVPGPQTLFMNWELVLRWLPGILVWSLIWNPLPVPAYRCNPSLP